MKNAIQYYYHLSPNKIHQSDGIYRFEIMNQYYVLYPYDGNQQEAKEFYELSIQLLAKNVYCHEIIKNNEQQIITFINGNQYILLRCYSYLNQKITLENIIDFCNSSNNINSGDILRRNNWKDLWSKKIDYFEYQINQFGKSYPHIRESFSYFSGLTEMGISLLDEISVNEETLVISHKRINKGETLFELYNPINFIIDTKIRDVCEYFKQSFLVNDNIYDDIIYYFYHNSLNTIEYYLFFIRMLYPTFYFDYFESIMEQKENDDKINFVVQKANQYEQLIKKLYHFIYDIVVFPEIEWLNNYSIIED